MAKDDGMVTWNRSRWRFIYPPVIALFVLVVCIGGGCAPPTSSEPLAEGTIGEFVSGDAASGTPDLPVERPLCEVGKVGCRCTPTSSCDKGLSCVNSVCRVCADGNAGCACLSDGSCRGSLSCIDGRCQGCQGKANCSCYGNQNCDPGLRCHSRNDGTDMCLPCDPKAPGGCSCLRDADCGAFVCANRRCFDPKTLDAVPKDPRCYSPCEGDVQQPDGTILTCHPTYRLRRGCLAGQTCVLGSCVLTEKANQLHTGEYPFCRTDANCPAWQVCLRGRCYSNCVGHSDCPSGFQCHQYACRRKCDVTQPECGTGSSCRSLQTDNRGVCLPRSTSPSGSNVQKQIREVFVLQPVELRFDRVTTKGEFLVENKGAFPIQVSIRRQQDGNVQQPLSWLKLDTCQTYNADRSKCQTFTGRASSKDPMVVVVPAKSQVILQASGASGSPSSYTGRLALSTKESTQNLALSYRKEERGRWRGKLYTFGNFNDERIERFPAQDSLRISDVPNALLQQWINLKRNQIDFAQFSAVLQSLQSGTWDTKTNRDKCKTLFSQQASNDVVCYPYRSKNGYEILSFSQRQAPVPSAVSSLDFVLDLEQASQATYLNGRVVSQEALVFPGNPAIQIELQKPAGTSANNFLLSLRTTIELGARYKVKKGQGCADTTRDALTSVPWLLFDFPGDSITKSSLLRERYECRTQTIPRRPAPGATAQEKAAIVAYNTSLSSANPIPDGRVLRRELSLVDGMVYQNQILFAIVKERFVSFFPGTSSALSNDLVRYGYILLKRVDDTPADFSAKGTAPITTQACTSSAPCPQGKECVNGTCREPSRLQQVACTPDVVQRALGFSIPDQKAMLSWSSSQLNDLVSVLITGQTVRNRNNAGLQFQPSLENQVVEYTYTHNNQKHYVHYLCEETGQFDGGPANAQQACPAASGVFFFSLVGRDTAALQAEPCNANGTCSAYLGVLRNSAVGFRENIPFQCLNTQQVVCNDPLDLRKGKVFYRPTQPGTFVSAYSDLDNMVVQAFRYRLKFVSRSGRAVGFAPRPCVPGATSTLYCYDSSAIESISQRVNCLEYILSHPTLPDKLSAIQKKAVQSTLSHFFSFRNRTTNGGIITEFGFEVLQAELKVMLGDEAYTRSLLLRYDKNNSTLRSFPGDVFEPGGVALSGVLGAEMAQLYTAAQYYQSVLDRFYAQSAVFSASFRSAETTFLRPEAISSYFQTLMRAASRKARIWSAIAKKYHALNRSDLAKQVLERTSAGTYIEMMVMTSLLRQLVLVLDRKQIDQTRQSIETITRTFSAALLEMQETYKLVSQELNPFGFVIGYVPFPALDRFSSANGLSNAFDVALVYTKQLVLAAQEKESLALDANQSHDTQAALFQSELTKIQSQFEQQLISLCGGVMLNGRLVPAIPENMTPQQLSKVQGNPCGRVQGSLIYEAYLAMEQVALEARRIPAMQRLLQQQMSDEEHRIRTYCRNAFRLSDITWTYQDKILRLSGAASKTQLIINQAMQAAQGLVMLATTWKCEVILGDAFGGNCAGAALSRGLLTSTFLAREAATLALSLQKHDIEQQLRTMSLQFTRSQLRQTCDLCPPSNPSCGNAGVARIESQSHLANLALQQVTLQQEALGTQIDMRLALQRIQRLRDRVARISREREDAIALLTNVQSTFNNPNVRIYKNDAVLSAETTFHDAIREAYRLTLIYEYYTGTSYAAKSDLFLIRMIDVGDKNVAAYVRQLEQAYRDFEEQNGKPDLRIAVLSLRDDLLRIPRTDQTNNRPRVLPLEQRLQRLRSALNDPKQRNDKGYISIPFELSVHQQSPIVSPVTYNHKILYIEAEIVGSDVGDAVGRVYLQQKGTGVIRKRDGSLTYYVLPARMAVINPFFNGAKVFTPEVYQNFRLQDRPFGNTRWELQLNMTTETANKDIALNAIEDIRLYVYYNDFTKE